MCYRISSVAALLLVANVATAADEAPLYPDKANLLIVFRGEGRKHPVLTAEDWATKRQHIIANMEKVMGPFPQFDRGAPPKFEIVEETEFPKYVRRKLVYEAHEGNRVPAYLLIPRGRKEGERLPAVLCPHPTQRQLGKGVVVGLGGKSDRHYAMHLVERGYVAFAPDYVAMGEYEYDPLANGFAGGTMLGIWNHVRAVDLLQSLPEVDGERIGAAGHSLGGHNAMFVAVFDQRIRCVVSNCGFDNFPKYYKGNLSGWAQDLYMPRIRTEYDLDPAKVPFDFPEVVAALAPRAFLASAPLHDHNFDVTGVRDCIRAAEPVYRLLGAEEKLKANYPDCAHDFPDDARKVAYEWLDRWLKPAGAAR
ncbi:MAG: alpha/beta hydrolase family protein [Planctomycetaceae bacterium]